MLAVALRYFDFKHRISFAPTYVLRGFGPASGRNFPVGPARAVRDASSSCPSDEGAGRVRSAVGSASVRHRSLRSSGETVARLHAPRTGRFSRLGQLRGVHGLTRQSPARGLGSMSRHRFRAQGFITEPPWTLRFHNPRRHNASKHVSPRNQHGSAGLTAGPRSSRDWLAWRT